MPAEILRRTDHYSVDFNEVRGQISAKRALEVASRGRAQHSAHWSTGSGKTMLAKRLPTIMPPLEFDAALELTKIHSVAGLTGRAGLVTERPFRSPHHTISDAGLIGGGAVPRPGEVSLAHQGVLFLDELPEFDRSVLEVLRQPLEDQQVTISRASMSLTFPASFVLAAAMNPCPCGFWNDPTRECRCSPNQIQRYVGRISGPLLDRIDIHIDVPAVKFRELRGEAPPETDSSADNSPARDQGARTATTSFRQREDLFKRGHDSTHDPRSLPIDSHSEKMLENAMRRLGLSARAYDRILKVSRTIADLRRLRGDQFERTYPKPSVIAHWIEPIGRDVPDALGGAAMATASIRNTRALKGGQGVTPLQNASQVCCALVSTVRIAVSCNSAVRKLLIRLGKSVILGSGKATTRAKRRITAALRVLEPRTASPRGHSEETVPLP